MSIVITGATGHLGRHVVESLARLGVPYGQIVAYGRDPERLNELAEAGVVARRIDYNQPDTLNDAFNSGDHVLLISGSEIGQRVAQHRAVIDAAKRGGVALIAYTSVVRADTSSMLLAVEHRETEAVLAESGVPFVLLRNGWYLENYTEQLDTTLQHGAVLGAAGDGLISAASRADYAAAAAHVLTTLGHAGNIYELGGDHPFTLAGLAATISDHTSRHIPYIDLPPDDYAAALTKAGVPDAFAALLADSDRGIAAGDLHVTTGDLRRLTGQPTTPLDDAVDAALARRTAHTN